MSGPIIDNARPRVELLGVNDKSIRERLYERAPRAIHIPLVFNWAEYGPEDAMLVHGGTIPLTYGEETLNLRSKYATHVSPYLNLFLQNANPILFKRLLPSDIGPKASLRISVEILEEELDEYEREIDGFFKYDINDDIVKTGSTVQGYYVKFHKEVVPNDPTYGLMAGKGAIKTGTLTNKAGQNSKIYPLLDVVAPHKGSKGNNYGIRISSPTTKDATPMRETLLDQDNCYPFRVSLVERKDDLTSSKEIADVYSGEKYNIFCLKPDLVDTNYNLERYFGHVVLERYQNINPLPGEPLKYGPFGQVYTYTDNIEHILKLFLTAENQHDYPQNDLFGYTPDTEEEFFYRVNLFNLTNRDGSPYQAIRFDTTTTDGIRFTTLTDHFMDGADDGTMTDDELAKLVNKELEDIGDPDSPYQDIISYPFSYFWDSGFPMETKYKMGYIISQRKNTNVSISTYVSGEPILTNAEETSRLIAIVERIRVFAESDYFSTPAFRCTVTQSSCDLIASSWKKRVPANIELADKVSKLAAGESFREAYIFDRPPASVFSLTTNVSCLWKPPTGRNRDWIAGGMWPEKLDQRRIFFPACKTIYKEDTSVLTSLIGAIILAECETVGILCHKQFSGRMAGKNDFIAGVEEYCTENLANRFGELTQIEPICYFTDADDHRGYSWTLKIKVYLDMMKTVETLEIEAYNINDIEPDSAAFKS